MLLTGFTIAIEEETSDRETPPTSGVCGRATRHIPRFRRQLITRERGTSVRFSIYECRDSLEWLRGGRQT